MNHFVLTGPESTGKTTLAQSLAEHYGTTWVPEFARPYLERLGREYQERDLQSIANGQMIWEATYARRAKELLFSDTSLLVIKIWSEVKYGRTHPALQQHLDSRTDDYYLLCAPDLPWEADPLREHPNERQWLFGLYHRELKRRNAPFKVITGRGPQRLKNAISAVEEWCALDLSLQNP